MTNKTSMEALEKAILSFCEVLEMDAGTNAKIQSIYRDSIIQRFEYSYELAWKLIQKVLFEQYGIEDIKEKTKKDLFREAKQRGLIDNLESWFKYHHARNSISHIYGKEMALAVLNDINDFSLQVEFTLNILKDLTD